MIEKSNKKGWYNEMKRMDMIKKALQDTSLSSVHIIPVEKKGLRCTDSKFGGDFYLPEGKEAPVGEDGEAMEFLAQIRLSQMPYLEGFPKEGLLQFFLCTRGDVMEEMDEGELASKGHFRVVYYPEITGEETSACEDKLPKERWGMEKWIKGMRFEQTKEVATLSVEGTDLGYEHAMKMLTPKLLLKAGYDLSDCPDTDQFFEDFGNWGCKVGGHPAIRQGDVRQEEEMYQAYTTLLFQMDFTTGEELEADTFVFFIKPEDLAKRNFEDVLLYWHNCY